MTHLPLSVTIGGSSLGTDRTVRPALASDASAIASLQHEAMRQTIREALGQEATEDDADQLLPEKASIEEHWRSTLSETPPSGCGTFVAIHGSQVGGFALAIPCEQIAEIPGKRPVILAGTEIAALVVDPSFQRSGHASRLMNAVCESVGKNNVRMWISANDEARQRLVQSAGFAPAGVRRTLQIGDSLLIEHLWWAELSA